jgi:hypothetical protein
MADREIELSYQSIMQKLCAVRDRQVLESLTDITPKKRELNKQRLISLQTVLRPQIRAKGGVKKIEEWLSEYDPKMSVPSRIEGLNLDWLEEDE